MEWCQHWFESLSDHELRCQHRPRRELWFF